MLFEILSRLGTFRYGTADKHLIQAVHSREYTISGGTFDPSFDSIVQRGQYYAIVGSIINDGVYQHGIDDSALISETTVFDVYALRMPREFLALVREMIEWNDKNGNSAFTSESFNGYSYTRDSSKKDMFAAFSERLRPWRKI